MRTDEGVPLVESKPPEDLAALTRLMALSCRVADAARTIEAMETADKIAEDVGVLAERLGYTADEVVRPLWSH